MIFDDPKKEGQLVLSKEYSYKLYLSSNLAYISAFTAMFNGYFFNYWVWMYTGAASNLYWHDPKYGQKRNVDIYMSIFNIATHFTLIYYNNYNCSSYYLPTFLFYLGMSSYANALFFGRFVKREDMSSAFHLFFHIFVNASAISLYTC